MLKLKCPECEKQILWDDFQPMTVQCSRCKKVFSVHQGLQDNIRRREEGEKKNFPRCPSCRGPVSRRWFILCPKCGKFILGKFSIHTRWFWISALITGYLLFTLYYILFIR